VILLVAGGLAAEDAKPELVRAVYLPKHLNAKSLAEALSKQFKGDAEITSLTDSGANAVLLSAPKLTTDSILSILDKLDRKPRLVEVQVALFEVRVKADEAKGKLTEADLKDLSGSSTRVFEKLAAFQKAGKISSLRKVELTAAENQKSQQQSGADKAMATTGGGGGFNAPNPRATTSISYRSVGWTVTATPQISEDGTITIELSMMDSQVLTPDDGVVVNGAVVPETTTTQLQSKINLASGTATLAQGVQSESKSQVVQTYVVVGTRIKDDPKLKQ
jgi:hypothetical protein